MFEFCLCSHCACVSVSQNGMFIFRPPWHGADELLRSWFKPNAPWRQICLQDVMNEVYAQRWIPLPLAFNHQGLKREKWIETDDAKIVHYKAGYVFVCVSDW